MCFTQTQATAATCQMIREFEGELSGVLMERICRQWAEWWQMTSASFVSPLDCLTSFLGISLSRVVSSFGLPVYSSIHSRRITNVPKLAITAESYFRRWRKPPEMPEVCRMRTRRPDNHVPSARRHTWVRRPGTRGRHRLRSVMRVPDPHPTSDRSVHHVCVSLC